VTASTDLTRVSLSEAAELVASKQASPLELTQACIDRAEALDPKLNVYFTRTFETALAEAKAATEAIAAGNYRGPLHGVPFALKDLYETAGVRTTAGSPFRKDFIPAEDAFVVSRLKDAGSVLLGKLNMHEWALGASNINTFFPTPRNPWDTERITGGSSGGAGAALAARLCYGAVGSDTRGSIRIPAALCGVTGLKPTYGRVSLRGVIPLTWSLDHAGPMARSVADCALILNAIAGYDPDDPTSIDAPMPDYAAYLEPGLDGLRIGLPRNFFFDADVVDPEVASAVNATRAVFASLGASVKAIDFPDPRLYTGSGFRAEATAYHEERLKQNPGGFSPAVRQRLTDYAPLTAMDYGRDRYAQLELKAQLRRLFEDVDLILTPTTPIAAFEITETDNDARNGALIRNTSPFNVAGIPTISVPCGFTSAGLPIGLSLAGREWDEGTVMRAGHAYQQVTEWHKREPAL
jgi:aspartyl-tRNA(Asn)/glutamyl-tRNA(Gln) amidotransferase subunit A